MVSSLNERLTTFLIGNLMNTDAAAVRAQEASIPGWRWNMRAKQ